MSILCSFLKASWSYVWLGLDFNDENQGIISFLFHGWFCGQRKHHNDTKFKLVLLWGALAGVPGLPLQPLGWVLGLLQVGNAQTFLKLWMFSRAFLVVSALAFASTLEGLASLGGGTILNKWKWKEWKQIKPGSHILALCPHLRYWQTLGPHQQVAWCHCPPEALGALVVLTPAQQICDLLTSCTTRCGLLELGRRGTMLHGSLRNIQHLDVTVLLWSVPDVRGCVLGDLMCRLYSRSLSLTPKALSLSNFSQFQMSSFADWRGFL